MVKLTFPGNLLLLKLLSAPITHFLEMSFLKPCFCFSVKTGRIILSKKPLTWGSDSLKNLFNCLFHFDHLFLYFLFQVSYWYLEPLLFFLSFLKKLWFFIKKKSLLLALTPSTVLPWIFSNLFLHLLHFSYILLLFKSDSNIVNLFSGADCSLLLNCGKYFEKLMVKRWISYFKISHFVWSQNWVCKCNCSLYFCLFPVHFLYKIFIRK